MSAPCGWLLSLGSNLEDANRLHAALDLLATLGPCAVLTAIRTFPARHSAGRYFGTLASLAWRGGRDTLDATLKQLETRLGRQRDNPAGEVAIDIDILAMRDGDRWLADAHALDKGEFGHADVRTMLQEAGLAIDTPDTDVRCAAADRRPPAG